MVLDEAFKLSARDEVLQRPDIRKTGIHPNFWYPVARSDNVKTGKPHGVSFAGEPIVLVRTECCSCPDFVDNKNGLFARCIGSTDFDGDRKPDYLLFNSITRQSAIWYLNNNVFISGLFGPTIASGWALVVTADFNSDGHPDYVLSNPVNRQTAIWYLNNNVYISAAYGPTPPAGWSLVTH